jgi:hypothetical protein
VRQSFALLAYCPTLQAGSEMSGATPHTGKNRRKVIVCLPHSLNRQILIANLHNRYIDCIVADASWQVVTIFPVAAEGLHAG